MRTTLLAVAALAALAAAPAPAAAQVQIVAGIRIPLPEVPAFVVIQPGIQVVQDFDDEVFLHNGAYWARRDDRWYRARGPRAEFVIMETRLVPEPLRRLPPGHYRRYRPPPPAARPVRVVEEHKLDKKEEKRLRKEEDRRRKAAEQDRKDHQDGHDHEHHDGKDR